MYKWTGDNLILASASPRRSEMLQGCKIPFEVIPSNCDEAVLNGENASDMVMRLSKLKADSIAANHEGKLILGADTTVLIGGEILGKPENKQDAFRMLSLIQGNTHEVVGAFTLINRSVRLEVTKLSKTLVTLRPLSSKEIESYIETGEPMDKAGSYAIQGIGASLVSEVMGSYTNVVGLDLSTLLREFIAHGYLVAK